MLNLFGYNVTLATNGKEAVSMTEQTGFDVIIMDLQMPNLSGFDATEQIRKSSGRNKDTPIIAVTAHASVITRQQCLKVGMNDFIGKPYDPSTFREVLEAWLPTV